jgi:hypothetical protein
MDSLRASERRVEQEDREGRGIKIQGIVFKARPNVCRSGDKIRGAGWKGMRSKEGGRGSE